ncbi:MAG: hypothetical protein JWN15_3635 [Firmicutes bacterium]|nr:hypothetical protein [Bacillota bacterium]
MGRTRLRRYDETVSDRMQTEARFTMTHNQIWGGAFMILAGGAWLTLAGVVHSIVLFTSHTLITPLYLIGGGLILLAFQYLRNREQEAR